MTRILKVIELSKPEGETSLSNVLFQLAQKVHRRGLIILFSDLLDEPSQVVKSLRSFRYRKHEILVFQILDRKEREFSFSKPAIFRDLENGDELIIQPKSIQHSYRQKFLQTINTYRRKLLESYIDYELMYTNTPYDKALFSYLQKRCRLL